MVIIFSTILSAYCLLMVVLMIGWVRVRRETIAPRAHSSPGISVVIAMRNESLNIEALLHDLSSVVYDKDKFEIVVVDDHSDDDSFSKAQRVIAGNSNFRLLQLPADKEGKKSALTFAISQSQFDIIATTDADCRVSKNWLQCIALSFDSRDKKMVVGAVKMIREKSFFSRLQIVEFSSLVGSTAATIGLGHPVMCNGANLAFRKEVFLEVNGYQDNIKIASGDDEFLMRKILNLYPAGISFLNYYEGVVASRVQDTVTDFVNQRLRWAGKWKHNTDNIARFLAVFIFLSQVSFLVLTGHALCSFTMPPLVVAKIFLEAVLLLWVGRFLYRSFDIVAFIVLQFFYPIYVIVVALYSLSGSYRWKSRNYK